jgi:hypothetical protein
MLQASTKHEYNQNPNRLKNPPHSKIKQFSGRFCSKGSLALQFLPDIVSMGNLPFQAAKVKAARKKRVLNFLDRGIFASGNDSGVFVCASDPRKRKFHEEVSSSLRRFYRKHWRIAKNKRCARARFVFNFLVLGQAEQNYAVDDACVSEGDFLKALLDNLNIFES